MRRRRSAIRCEVPVIIGVVQYLAPDPPDLYATVRPLLEYASVKRLILLTVLLTACNRAETPQTTSSAPPPPAPAANVEHGKQLAMQYGCGVCHIIPGIEGAEGALGPTL